MMEATPFTVIAIVLAVFLVLAQWQLFEKAGQPGWACIVPFYNLYIMTKIVGKPGWWVVLMCIPYVNFVFIVWLYNLLSKSFGKGVGFTIGMLFLPYVFIPILAFGDAEYQGPSAGKTESQRFDH